MVHNMYMNRCLKCKKRTLVPSWKYCNNCTVKRFTNIRDIPMKYTYNLTREEYVIVLAAVHDGMPLKKIAKLIWKDEEELRYCLGFSRCRSTGTQ